MFLKCSNVSNSRFFKQGHCKKILLVRKNSISNIILSQTSYSNFDKFGIGNNVPDWLRHRSHIKLWAYWSRPRLDFYASSTTIQQPVTISNTFLTDYQCWTEIFTAWEGLKETLKKFTVTKSIKSVLIKIIDFLDARTLGNCEKISCEYEVYAGHEKLGLSAGLGPSAVVTAIKDIIETFLAVRPQRNVHGITESSQYRPAM